MLSSKLANIPYPEMSDIPNNQTAWANMAGAIDTQMIARFASTAARDAAITSPIEGQICYVSATTEERFFIRQGGAWVPINFAHHVLKPTNESRTNTTTRTPDAHLNFDVKANATYRFAYYMKFDGTTAADAIYQFSFPAGTTFAHVNLAPHTTVTNAGGDIMFGFSSVDAQAPAIGLLGAGTFVLVRAEGIIRTAATAGTVTLNWAQLAASGVSTIMYANSSLIYQRLD